MSDVNDIARDVLVEAFGASATPFVPVPFVDDYLVARLLRRIAGKVLARHDVVSPELARAIVVAYVKEGSPPLAGILDITLYRDDLSTVGANPIVNRTELEQDIENKIIVLIDDVLYTGRTIRAAMDQLMDFGRPRKVQLAVLIDRGREHRELPIQADFIGKIVPTKQTEIIKVMLKEFDEIEAVGIFERP